MKLTALPVSPYAASTQDALRRKQLDYLAVERWRWNAAKTRLPAYFAGETLSASVHGAWAGLGLWPHEPHEIDARLAELDTLEARAMAPDYCAPGSPVVVATCELANFPF
jgi:hypothetical protein